MARGWRCDEGRELAAPVVMRACGTEGVGERDVLGGQRVRCRQVHRVRLGSAARTRRTAPGSTYRVRAQRSLLEVVGSFRGPVRHEVHKLVRSFPKTLLAGCCLASVLEDARTMSPLGSLAPPCSRDTVKLRMLFVSHASARSSPWTWSIKQGSGFWHLYPHLQRIS